MRGITVWFILVLWGIVGLLPGNSVAQERGRPQIQFQGEYRENELLVKYKAGISRAQALSSLANNGLEVVEYYPQIGVSLGRVREGTTFHAAVEACQNDPAIEYVEPNYIYHIITTEKAPAAATAAMPLTPNDPRFRDLWGFNQSNDRDIDAPEAWDIQTGKKEIIVAIIDTGIDYDHEDLKENIWLNPGESGNGKENNGVDDDGNGFVDDYRGWNFIFDSNDPWDDNGHGTHVAGTVGAVGNNGKGVVGVNWRVSLMPLKFLDREGSGSLSDAIQAILYAADNGAHVMSNSWGGGGFSQALKDAIEYARSKNALFVAAAGNDSNNNDRSANYPSNYEVPNVVAVAATDRGDNLASFSNYGETTVDLAAPGVSILSCAPRDRYQLLSGTSMATPHVSGAAALILAQYPNLNYRQVLIRILGTVDRKSNLAGRMVTGGRLNVARALTTDPVVALVTPWKNTPDTSGPYKVSAEAIDDGGIAQMNLHYSLNGGAENVVPMQQIGPDKYEAAIPGQPLETTIAYFVEATDNAGNKTRSRTFSFRITTEPANGGNCCGALGFSMEKNTHIGTRAFLAVANLLVLIGIIGAAGRIRRK